MIVRAFSDVTVPSYAFAAKLAFTSVTVGSGFMGGEAGGEACGESQSAFERRTTKHVSPVYQTAARSGIRAVPQGVSGRLVRTWFVSPH